MYRRVLGHSQQMMTASTPFASAQQFWHALSQPCSHPPARRRPPLSPLPQLAGASTSLCLFCCFFSFITPLRRESCITALKPLSHAASLPAAGTPSSRCDCAADALVPSPIVAYRPGQVIYPIVSYTEPLFIDRPTARLECASPFVCFSPGFHFCFNGTVHIWGATKASIDHAASSLPLIEFVLASRV